MHAPTIDRPLSIGELARRTGLNVSALRYYEEVGLIAAPSRRPSGHRVYDEKVQEVLALIRHCRDFGFSIEETRALVSLSTNNDSDCAQARDIAQVQLDAVRARLAELQTLERSLSRFVKACSDECLGGPAAECTILKDLGTGGRGSPDAPSTRRPGGCCG